VDLDVWQLEDAAVLSIDASANLSRSSSSDRIIGDLLLCDVKPLRFNKQLSSLGTVLLVIAAGRIYLL
jgi:hypothetical protein